MRPITPEVELFFGVFRYVGYDMNGGVVKLANLLKNLTNSITCRIVVSSALRAVNYMDRG